MSTQYPTEREEFQWVLNDIRAEQSKPTVEPEPCVWRGLPYVKTTCGQSRWVPVDLQPLVSSFNKCPYCGAPLKVER